MLRSLFWCVACLSYSVNLPQAAKFGPSLRRLFSFLKNKERKEEYINPREANCELLLLKNNIHNHQRQSLQSLL